MSDPALTIYRELEQRSPEWVKARAGLVTASTVGRLITTGPPGADTFGCAECTALAGEPCMSLRGAKPIKTLHGARHAKAAEAVPVLTVADNDTARGLIATLAAERITGHVESGPMTSDMLRGIDSEPFARDAYAEHHGVVVEEVGFMVRDFGHYSIGASPDGLVGDTGGIEIKAPRAKGHIGTVLAGEVPAQYVAQVQTLLLVSGRGWWDFVSFNGGMHLYTTRVHPDPAWFEAIKAAAAEAERAIADITTRYEAAVAGLPMTERIPDPYAEIAV